jgi:hypothetical protein
MNAKTAFAAVALFLSIAAGVTVGSPARARDDGAFTAQMHSACASGYHPDARGNCQPDNSQPNLQPCPDGYLATPFPSWGNSYKCVPIPVGY